MLSLHIQIEPVLKPIDTPQADKALCLRSCDVRVTVRAI